MKAIAILIIVLCFHSLNLKAQADKSAIYISLGLPITTTPAKIGKLSSKIAYYSNFHKTYNLCIGVNYDYIELSRSNNRFTYDKEYIGAFLGANYQFIITEKLRLYPEFNIGYSIVNYSLNEFEIDKQNTSGFLLSGGFKFYYKLNNKIGLNLSWFNTTLLKELNANIDFPIPANYISTSQKYQNNMSIELGLVIEL